MYVSGPFRVEPRPSGSYGLTAEPSGVMYAVINRHGDMVQVYGRKEDAEKEAARMNKNLAEEREELAGGGVVRWPTFVKGTREEAEAFARNLQDRIGGVVTVGKEKLEGIDAWEIFVGPPPRAELAEGGVIGRLHPGDTTSEGQEVTDTHSVEIDEGDDGTSAVCSCGWVGSRRESREAALDDAHDHLAHPEPEFMAEGGIVKQPWPTGESLRTHLKEDHGYKSDAGIEEDVSYHGLSPRALHSMQHKPPFGRTSDADHSHTDMELAEGGVVKSDYNVFNGAGEQVDSSYDYYYAKELVRELWSKGDMQAKVLDRDGDLVLGGPPLDEGIALVENQGPGVPAIIGEAGPEAVIPLDDPEAVEVMAEAIEEGGAGGDDSAAEEVAEAATAVAEAAEAVAEAAVAEVEVAEEIVETVAELAEDVTEEVADVAEEAIEEASENAETMEELAEEVAEDSLEVAEEATEEAAEVIRDVAPRSRHWSEKPLAELFKR